MIFNYPGSGSDKRETAEDRETQLGSNCKNRTEMRDWNLLDQEGGDMITKRPQN